MSENIAVSMGKELNRFMEEYKPTGYDAPITPITTDLTMMEIGYRKACKHMIERLEAVENDNNYRYDRMPITDDYGFKWYVKLEAAVGIAEDLLAEADHWVKEDGGTLPRHSL